MWRAQLQPKWSPSFINILLFILSVVFQKYINGVGRPAGKWITVQVKLASIIRPLAKVRFCCNFCSHIPEPDSRYTGHVHRGILVLNNMVPYNFFCIQGVHKPNQRERTTHDTPTTVQAIFKSMKCIAKQSINKISKIKHL